MTKTLIKVAENDTLGFLRGRLHFLENDVKDGIIVMGDEVFKFDEYAHPIDNIWPKACDEEIYLLGQIVRKQSEKRKQNKNKEE